MRTPVGLEPTENCLSCKVRVASIFCNLPATAFQTFEAVKYVKSYPKGTLLFAEGQTPRGIFVLCKGRVQLSICSADGGALILKIAKAGAVLGLSAMVSGTPYELTAETVSPCQVKFVKREDFQRLLRESSDACLHVAQQLSEKYNAACRKVRVVVVSHSAEERLAKLLFDWSAQNGEAAKTQPRVKLMPTHDKMAQLIGTSRETVSRLLADLKRRNIIQAKGSILIIRKKTVLSALAGLQ